MPENRNRASVEAAEDQIRGVQRIIDYQIREYPVEVLVAKHLDGQEEGENEIFVPDYQRDLVWSEEQQSRFIESILMGLPIPYLFVADVSSEDEELSGRMEIVDGTQRIRTLGRFVQNELELKELKKLDKLNGFKFSDLALSRQRRFGRATLRLIELTESTDEETRREMFDRINTGGTRLEEMERRRGSKPGPFVDLVKELAREPLFAALAPVSLALVKRFEREEMVLRFFAFMDGYESFGRSGQGKVVSEFVDRHVDEMNKRMLDPTCADLREKIQHEWRRMLEFVDRHFPNKFKKKASSRSTPRVRFEAIAVGVGLALRENPDLIPIAVEEWIDTPEFRGLTTSDAANNGERVRGRINYVRARLLGQ